MSWIQVKRIKRPHVSKLISKPFELHQNARNPSAGTKKTENHPLVVVPRNVTGIGIKK